MPWENKGGGGGPWGGGSGGGGGPRPPDFEDFIRKGQDRVRRMMPGGGGRFGKTGIIIVLLALLGLWGFTGFYRVQTNEQGVVLRFGQWVDTTSPGLHWHWPSPIEEVILPSVTSVQQIDVGFQFLGDRRGGQKRAIPAEGLMLTGDQNIIDIQFTVQWRISDAGQYLFKIRDREATVKILAESAMREVIGRTPIQLALAEGRGKIEVDAREVLQETLDEYEAGIEITGLVLQQVQPPSPVIDAFNDVQRALQDRDRLKKQAEAYSRDVVPRARGQAAKMIQEAEAYRERLVNEAEGEAQRFLQVYSAYQVNPDVTRKRMYLETMEGVLSETDKIIMEGGTQSPLPYLPLPELRRGSENEN
ncbi:MAG: FtsH protease activity modulator HflK [Kiloniellales bacterium]|nr:FtsH protease activity modulator HflK [Kiloniellales bacterium]